MAGITFASSVDSDDSKLIRFSLLYLDSGFCSVCIYGFPELPVVLFALDFRFDVIGGDGSAAVIKGYRPTKSET